MVLKMWKKPAPGANRQPVAPTISVGKGGMTLNRGVYRRFKAFLVFISPLHRVRSTEGKFLGVVIMLPYIDHGKLTMRSQWWLCNFK